MKFDDIRSQSPDELNKELLALKKEQMNLRFQKTGGQLANPNRIREVRKTIARINTALTEKTTKQAAAPKTPARAKKKAS